MVQVVIVEEAGEVIEFGHRDLRSRGIADRDGAVQAADGYFRILGRVDDVINVAGHRLGTKELESAALTVPEVAEAAAVPVTLTAVMATAVAAAPAAATSILSLDMVSSSTLAKEPDLRQTTPTRSASWRGSAASCASRTPSPSLPTARSWPRARRIRR